jgi:hypothetical protein
MARTPLSAIRRKCVDDCSAGSAKYVAYCPSHDCPLWPYRFGKRPATVRERIGAAMLSPALMPDPGTPLGQLPNNPAEYCLAIEGRKAQAPVPKRRGTRRTRPASEAAS